MNTGPPSVQSPACFAPLASSKGAEARRAEPAIAEGDGPERSFAGLMREQRDTRRTPRASSRDQARPEASRKAAEVPRARSADPAPSHEPPSSRPAAPQPQGQREATPEPRSEAALAPPPELSPGPHSEMTPDGPSEPAPWQRTEATLEPPTGMAPEPPTTTVGLGTSPAEPLMPAAMPELTESGQPSTAFPTSSEGSPPVAELGLPSTATVPQHSPAPESLASEARAALQTQTNATEAPQLAEVERTAPRQAGPPPTQNPGGANSSALSSTLDPHAALTEAPSGRLSTNT